MKNQRIFPGIILIGFGIYFSCKQAKFHFFQSIYMAYADYDCRNCLFIPRLWGKDYEAILPGVILTGFGFHFHVVNRFSIWPDARWCTYSYSLLSDRSYAIKRLVMVYFKESYFLAFAGLMIILSTTVGWLGLLTNKVDSVVQYWPILLILIGIYLLFLKKKRKKFSG